MPQLAIREVLRRSRALGRFRAVATAPGDGFAPSGRSPWMLAALAALLLAGGVLRFWRLDWELAHQFHPDEPVKIKVILSMIERRSLDPNYFRHPPFMLYCTAGCSLLAHAALGWPLDEATVNLAGRFWVALLGSLTLAPVFLLGRELCRAGPAADARRRGPWCDLGGLLAAAWFAVLPLHVHCSHFLKEDAPLTFFMAWTAWASVRLARHGDRSSYLLTTVAAALALSSKHTGVLSIGFLTLGHLAFRFASAGWRGLFVRSDFLPGCKLAGLGAVVYLAANPGVVLDPCEFYRDARYEREHVYVAGHLEMKMDRAASGWTYYLRQPLSRTLGRPLFVLGLAGLLLNALRRERGALVLAGMTLLTLFALEAAVLKVDRYVLVLLPALVAFAAGAAMELARFALDRREGRRNESSPRYAAYAVLLALACGVAARPAAETVRRLGDMETDTRTRLAAWLRREAAPGQNLLLIGLPHWGPRQRQVDGHRLWAEMHPVPSVKQRSLDLSTGLYAIGNAAEAVLIDHVIVTSIHTDWITSEGTEADPTAQAMRGFLAELSREWGPPAAEIEAPSGPFLCVNPTLRVYRRPLR